MSLRRRVEYNLSRLVDVISKIEGVIAIILFGSLARGDYDEYSDYDILVVFRDRDVMWRNWDRLFSEVGRLRLLIHLIPKTYEELLNSEPTFLNEIYKYGILLYSKYPFKIKLGHIGLKHRKLIIYSLRGLRQSQKSKLLYILYGRRSLKKDGLVSEIGGEKLGEGCIIIPAEHTNRILKIFMQFNLKPRIIDIYTPNPTYMKY